MRTVGRRVIRGGLVRGGLRGGGPLGGGLQLGVDCRLEDT